MTCDCGREEEARAAHRTSRARTPSFPTTVWSVRTGGRTGRTKQSNLCCQREWVQSGTPPNYADPLSTGLRTGGGWGVKAPLALRVPLSRQNYFLRSLKCDAFVWSITSAPLRK